MSHNLLLLLQLCNSSLPLGAYSYSEGLETLVEEKLITSADTLNQWLVNELKYGSIRVESALLLRSYACYLKQDLAGLFYWNNWLSATRETQELRQQSWQMGKSLLRLIPTLISNNPQLESLIKNFDSPCNYAIAFGILTAHWQIHPEMPVARFRAMLTVRRSGQRHPGNLVSPLIPCFSLLRSVLLHYIR